MMSQADCIFCNPRREILAENAHALAFFDSYPVSRGHALVVPKRHAITIFDLSGEEYAGCFRLVLPLKEVLLARYAPDGFNVGANCGEAAGQSVWHAHVHVIPRYTGDVPNPRGGVRGVIPQKASY
jgi:diadenosine tetraphosphate (Ap4A) HIT family hydrolase